jgi:hypothetical protein
MSDPILDYILEDCERLELALMLAPTIQAAKEKVFAEFWQSVKALVNMETPDGWTIYIDPNITYYTNTGFSLLPPGCQRASNSGPGTSAFYYYHIESLRDSPYYGIRRSSDKLGDSMEISIIEKLKADGFSNDATWLGKKPYGLNVTSRIRHYPDASILDLFDEWKAAPRDQTGLAHQVALEFAQLITKYMNDVVTLNERVRAKP